MSAEGSQSQSVGLQDRSGGSVCKDTTAMQMLILLHH